ncbi:hypothetical protein DEU56DRAFT_941459 [Suillus clintonianus]|uniref:uncharacterized protein n=1 Tax=Suillus clintonianus TaxID=1904413 RepID=UPI001B867066|nr:uncharacterized protein DEU56DRAFT_941459 [Suillus clintonianus]KAG2108086.1 hypothetical protein DEU56DRAFT_941459 [Suillus clintonianus]
MAHLLRPSSSSPRPQIIHLFENTSSPERADPDLQPHILPQLLLARPHLWDVQHSVMEALLDHLRPGSAHSDNESQPNQTQAIGLCCIFKYTLLYILVVLERSEGDVLSRLTADSSLVGESLLAVSAINTDALGHMLFRILPRGGIEVDASRYGTVRFENIGFGYPSQKGVQILDNFNLEVGVGESVAIVGKSGGGKSSIQSLLLRYYGPVRVKMTFDGQGGIYIREFNPSSWRSIISIIPQASAPHSFTESSLSDNEKEPFVQMVKEAKALHAKMYLNYKIDPPFAGVYRVGKQDETIESLNVKQGQCLLLHIATANMNVNKDPWPAYTVCNSAIPGDDFNGGNEALNPRALQQDGQTFGLCYPPSAVETAISRGKDDEGKSAIEMDQTYSCGTHQ